MNLGAWMRIAQSLVLLLLEPAINWVLFIFFKIKIVTKALRVFPQFEGLANNKLLTSICIYMF
jgi:hypothetical protein